MLQAVMIKPGAIKIQQIDRPTIHDDEVMVQVKRIGVCGSDIHVFHGSHPYTGYPIVQGHEVSGVISEIGSAVKDLRVGEKVVFMPQVTCGECFPCKSGQYHICDNLKVMGFQTDGAGQEFFPVPASKVLKIPEHVSLDQAAMVEPVSVAVHALSRFGPMPGAHVLVLGAGTIGNLVAQCARAMGAAKVMITDVSDWKLAKARECGIEYSVNTSRDDLKKAIDETFGFRKTDVILECVGVQPTITQAVNVARKGSTIVVVGVFGQKPVVDLGLVQDRELSLVGTLMYQYRDYEKAIQLVSNGQINLDPMITHRFLFQDYFKAYQTIEESNGEYLKVMIDL